MIIDGKEIVKIIISVPDYKRHYVWYELSQKWVEVTPDEWSKWYGIKKIL